MRARLVISRAAVSLSVMSQPLFDVTYSTHVTRGLHRRKGQNAGRMGLPRGSGRLGTLTMTAIALAQPVEGRLAGREHRFPLRVYFEDTDLSGVVYHANYLRFMERARSDMLLAAGIDQRAAHEGGEGAYAIANLAIRYRAPA